MADRRVLSRMKKELERLKKDPPHGVTCWCKQGKLNNLEANLLGGEGTPYEGGVFKLDIEIPSNYPFQPPHVQFLTKIYHPNIDTAGRICLDVLKSPPTGSWKPAHNLHTILTSIQLLLAEPNPDDGLMADISSEYKHKRPTFIAKAKEWTCKYAKNVLPQKGGGNNGACGSDSNQCREAREVLDAAASKIVTGFESIEVPKDGSSKYAELKGLESVEGLGEGSSSLRVEGADSNVLISDVKCVTSTKEETVGIVMSDSHPQRQEKAGQDKKQKSDQSRRVKRKRVADEEEAKGNPKKKFIEL